MRTQAPASRALAASTRRRPAARDDGVLLAAIACVLAAILLYAVCVAVWDPGDDEILDTGSHPSFGPVVALGVVASRDA